MAEEVLYSVADGVATITLNRPDHLNAFNRTMFAELLDAFDATDTDDAVRAVIVTGAGRAFCAGADLGAGRNTFHSTVEIGHGPAPRDTGGELVLRIFRSLKPVIAAINGPAVGVGASMTLPMDIRILAEGAKVGFVFARRGIVPDGAASWFLPRVVGINRALEWCLTGRVFSATEALDGGLVRSLHPADEVVSLGDRAGAGRSRPTWRLSPPCSPASCCGRCSAPTTRWSRTASTRGRSMTPGAWPTRPRGSPRSWRSARRSGLSPPATTSPTGSPGARSRRTLTERRGPGR